MFFDEKPIFEFRGPWGVPVQIGPSILLLPLIFVSFTMGPVVLFYDLIFLTIVIGSIFLHELGHAWGCLIQGVRVNRIMLYGGGGFCEQATSASRYEQELIVAMGPIVNMTLWAVASLSLRFVENPDLYWAIATVAYVNLFLAVMNLLPVMPLDGGRLFELTLHRVIPGPMATRIAGAVGLTIAVLWIPMMMASYVFFGLLLFFIPPILLHWRMVRHAQ